MPIGSYTRETLAKLPPAQEQAILANVRSNEPDVKGIVGKLTQGAVDAGFVYVTDVNATGGELKAIELPPDLEPQVTYAAGVVRGREAARARRGAYLDGLRRGRVARTRCGRPASARRHEHRRAWFPVAARCCRWRWR